MNPTPTSVFVAALVGLLVLGVTHGEAAERQVRGGFALQMNPIGVRADLEAIWRRRLSASTHPLLRDAHLAFGVGDQLTPASNQTQAWIEVSPLSILDIRAGVTGVAYFGTFGNLVGLKGYGSDFSDDARKALEEGATSGVGRRFFVSPALKFKAGRVSVRTTADFESWKVKDAPGPVYYEPNRGTLLDARGDSLVSGSNVVLCDLSKGGAETVRVGVLHDYLKVWDAPSNRRQRVGPLALIKLGEGRLGGRDRVLSFAVLKYLKAPDRTGVGGFVSLTMALGGGSKR